MKVVRFSSPSTLDASPGAATMGRTREENENRAKVSLYIIKRSFQKARKQPGGCLQENEQWEVSDDGGDRLMKKK